MALTTSQDMLVETEPLLHLMSLEQQAAQLMLVTYPGQDITEDWEDLYRRYNFGGIILQDRNLKKASQTRQLIAGLQDYAQETGVGLPLMVGIDQEGGTHCRLSFGRAISPGSMALGATRNSENAYEAARLCAGELKSYGITLNLCPVADINGGARASFIGVRSFGEREEIVSQMTAKTVKGLQENGVGACVKHFPGLGDVAGDPYLLLPTMDTSLERLESTAFKPFTTAINVRCECVLAGHAIFPATGSEDLPASLSQKLLTGYLRSSMRFKGLIICDALDATSITNRWPLEEAAIMAMRAGADMIIVQGGPSEQMKVFNGILQGITNGYYEASKIEEAARRVLKQKFRRSHELQSFTEDPHPVLMKIAQESMTLVKNEGGVLPLNLGPDDFVGILNPDPPNRDILTLADTFREKHASTEEVRFDPTRDDLNLDEVHQRFARCRVIIVATYSSTLLSDARVASIKMILSWDRPVILLSLNSPFHLMQVPEVPVCLLAYGYSPYSLEAAVEVLLGEAPPRGRLPVSLPGLYEYGHGVSYPARIQEDPG